MREIDKMDNRPGRMEAMPIDPEAEVIGSNQVLTLITTEDGMIPTSTEVTVLTTALGDVPLMTAIGTLAETLGTTHPTFVTSHPGVSTVFATSIAPSHSIHSGQAVVVSDASGRLTLVGSDGLPQTLVLHAADPSEISSALAHVHSGTEPTAGIVSIQEVPVPAGTMISQNAGKEVEIHARSPSLVEMREVPPTQIISHVVDAGGHVIQQPSSSMSMPSLEHVTTEVATIPANEIVSYKPAESVPDESQSISIPHEVVCIVCYQSFSNPKLKKDEAMKSLEGNEIVASGREESSAYGKSLGKLFELSRVSMSIVTRRSYKDYEVPICQSCNENLTQIEDVIRDLKRLEKELFVMRQKVKDDITKSFHLSRSGESKELMESRRKNPALAEILEVVDRIREDIVNDGRPPKISRLSDGSNRRGRKPKGGSLKEKALMEGVSGAEHKSTSNPVPFDTSTKDPLQSDNDDRASATENKDASGDATSVEKPEKQEVEEKDVKPAIRTSFGRIVKRPAYMMMVNEGSEDELSELGESSDDNYEEIEVKPDIPLIGEDEAAASLPPAVDDEMLEEEDPAWSPGREMVISEKIGLPTTSSEESEEASDYDSDSLSVREKKETKERKRRKSKGQSKPKRKNDTSKLEDANYEVKVIQLDGTELMTINTGAHENIGLEPELTQKVMDSQAVIELLRGKRGRLHVATKLITFNSFRWNSHKAHTCTSITSRPLFPLSNSIMVKNQLYGKRVQCPHCPRTFTDPVRRDVHVKKKHEGDAKPYGCSFCNKRFGRQDHLRNHMKRHSRPQPDTSTKSKSSSTQKNHSCQFCDQRFRNKSELSIHTRTHTGERPFKCESCSEAFVSALKREFHIEQMHPEVPPIRCPDCPRGFYRQHRLRIHSVSHTGEKTNICEICGKCFSQPAMLRYHQTTHEELNLKQFKCQECNRIFANPQNLKSHMESQHQKMYRHRCQTCGRGYTQMSHLRRHLRTHSGEQPYVCSYCPKKFTSGAALKIHVRIHTGERPYWCAQCEKGFRSKTKLGRHMKTLIHSNDKAKKEAAAAETETMDANDANDAGTSTTWTEIVGIITGV